MRAPTLAIALLLSQGCAPVTLGTTSSALVSSGGSQIEGEDCISREYCAPAGGSGSVTIPLLIILTAVTVPAFVHYYLLGGDPERSATPASTGSEARD